MLDALHYQATPVVVDLLELRMPYLLVGRVKSRYVIILSLNSILYYTPSYTNVWWIFIIILSKNVENCFVQPMQMMSRSHYVTAEESDGGCGDCMLDKLAAAAVTEVLLYRIIRYLMDVQE
jgi:hypothetical protein